MNAPSLAHTLKVFVSAMLDNVHTCIPAQVQSYDAKKQQANVSPTITRILDDGTEEKYPLIHSVPVMFPRTRRGSFTMPLEKGDYVLLLFSERSLDTWVANGGIAETILPNHFDLTDAIAIAGIYPFSDENSAASDTDAVLHYEDTKITLKRDGKIILAAKNVDVVLASGGQLNVAGGNLTVDA